MRYIAIGMLVVVLAGFGIGSFMGSGLQAQDAEAPTATPTPTATPVPAAGEVNHATGCEWVANSYTELFKAVYGLEHAALVPTAMVEDRILNGFVEDGTTHRFRWWHIGPSSMNHWDTWPLIPSLLVRREYQRTEDYEVSYRRMKEFLAIGRYIEEIYLPVGNTLSIEASTSRSGAAYLRPTTGSHWAYIHGIRNNASIQPRSHGCWQFIPNSTPPGHEAFITE